MPRYSPGICPSGNPYAPPSALSTGSRTRQCGSSSIFIPPTAADGGPTRRTGSYSSFTNTRQRCLRTGADTAIPRQAATGIKPSNWIWWHRIRSNRTDCWWPKSNGGGSLPRPAPPSSGISGTGGTAARSPPATRPFGSWSSTQAPSQLPFRDCYGSECGRIISRISPLIPAPQRRVLQPSLKVRSQRYGRTHALGPVPPGSSHLHIRPL